MQSSKIYNYLFYSNLYIIIFAIIYAIFESFFLDNISKITLSLNLYFMLILLSWSFCITFFIINVYGFITKKLNRIVHLLLIIIFGLDMVLIFTLMEYFHNLHDNIYLS